ncbi:MAG TPA: hypothetical protein VGO59_02820 [Verrucomicrobiae bacterium]|jgi:hypothetical protein
MAIRLNLLAEAQAAEEMRRKNPVKLGIWIGSFCVVVVLLWILELQLEIGVSKKTYNTIAQSWKDDNAKYSTVTNNIARIAQMELKSRALDTLATNRFYWAPILNALQQTVIDNIQIIRLSGVQKYTKEEAKTIGAGPTAKRIPGDVVEGVSLYIDAKDFNPNAQNYDKFKETLCNNDFFVKNLGRKDGFILDGVLSTPTVEAADPNRQFVTFRLASHWPDKRRDD